MDLFDLLDHFDMAATHDMYASYRNRARMPHENPTYWEWKGMSGINTGLVAWRKNRKVWSMAKEWERLFLSQRRNGGGGWQWDDQTPFQAAFMKSQMQFYVLPPEWNCRYKLAHLPSGPLQPRQCADSFDRKPGTCDERWGTNYRDRSFLCVMLHQSIHG